MYEQVKFVLDRWNQNVAKVDVVPNPFEQKIEVIFYVHNLRVPEVSRTIIQRRYPIVGEVIVRLEQYNEAEKKKKSDGDILEGEYDAGLSGLIQQRERTVEDGKEAKD